MKAINYGKYGSSFVLKLRGVKKPEPKDNEVFIEIHATTRNMSDWQLLREPPFITCLMFGQIKPKYQILRTDRSRAIYN